MDNGLRPDWLTPDLLPFESRFTEIDGNVVHYLDEGSGPPLLMLHGNPTWSFLYRHLIALLRGRFRCIAPDLPGFGLSIAAPGYDLRPESHAEVVRLFVDRLGLDAWTPVLQDWGGPIGVDVAGAAPERIRAMVVLNTFAWPVDDDPHFVWFSRIMGSAPAGFLIRHFNVFVNFLIPAGTPRSKPDRTVLDAYRRPLDTPSRRAASHVLPGAIRSSTPFLAEVERRLARLRDVPALIVWGDGDIAFREKERARFEASFARAASLVVPGAGHYMQEEAPREIATALERFWPEV